MGLMALGTMFGIGDGVLFSRTSRVRCYPLSLVEDLTVLGVERISTGSCTSV